MRQQALFPEEVFQSGMSPLKAFADEVHVAMSIKHFETSQVLKIGENIVYLRTLKERSQRGGGK